MTRQTDTNLPYLSTTASDRYVEDLTNGVRRGGIVLDPPYQRGEVWTLDQRIALMKSWLMGAPIPAVILNNRMGAEWAASDPDAQVAYAVIDGRQRLTTALMWGDGDLAIPVSWLPDQWIDTVEDTDDGPYVRGPGLTQVGSRLFRARMTVPCVISRVATVDQEAQIYLLVNTTGTAQTTADLTRAADTGDERSLFVPAGAGNGTLRCIACGAIDQIEHHEVPSMAGYGHDTATRCRACGATAITDPIFGTTVTGTRRSR